MPPTISQVKKYSEKLELIAEEIGKVVIGNEDVIKAVLRAILSNGHVLIEGSSGVGKTLLIKALHKTIKGVDFKRIQFTVDMLPSDITGSEVYRKETGTFDIQIGPVYTNLLLADEINRSPPKVQSALLQSMEEREVTIGKKTIKLPSPFFVLATINPQEEQGVFTLPEAQVDRFLFNIRMLYLGREREMELMENNVETKSLDEFGLKQVVTGKDILEMQKLTKMIELPEEVKEYSVDIIEATRHPQNYNYKMKEYVKWGGSPRATISLNFAGRANALLEGRNKVEIDDIKIVAPHVLRHRIILSYEGQARNIEREEIVKSLLKEIPTLG